MKESLIFKRSNENPNRWDFQYSMKTYCKPREHGPHLLTGPYLVILAEELFKPFEMRKHE